MLIGARTATWSGEEEVNILDGYRYDSIGNLYLVCGAILDYIPCKSNHTITWQGLDGVVVLYDSQRKFFNYWESRGSRTVVMPQNTVYIRVAFGFGGINSATIHDDTDGVYIFKDGKIVNGGGGYKLICATRRYTRFSRPSARFSCHTQELEVAA